ncbi:MFS transporter [Streptomyces violens]|uniref:MFS transporter n=1 Tax=Streptomyces violens TaxID=66377 RepID=UPI0004C158DF|nr:MFS transporter [Streptomyces violens]
MRAAERTAARRPPGTFLGCFSLVLAVRAVMVLLPGLVPMVLVAFVIGLASGPLNPLITATVQEVAPEQLRGRAFGTFSTLGYAAAPFGPCPPAG